MRARPIAVACICAVLAPTSLYAAGPRTQRATSHARSASILPIFKPLLPGLAKVQLPVYLPSWLPANLDLGHLGPIVVRPSTKNSYAVGLSNRRTAAGWQKCAACTAFSVMGLQGKPLRPRTEAGYSVRAVRVDATRIGYVDQAVNTAWPVYFVWGIGNNSYLMHMDNYESDSTFAAVARSFVPIHPSGSAPPPPVGGILLDVQGSGVHTTQWFHAPAEWKISWSYDCSAYGSRGNFIVDLWSGPTSLVDGVANTLGSRGNGMTYEHQGGRFYLKVNSECNWHIQAHL
jgi:hypothetical protein